MATSIDNVPPVWIPGNGTEYPPAHEVDIDYTQPRGLVGEMASHIYCASRKQVKEVALAGAIAYCAGIFGRGYNVTGTGLNQYIILLTDTGIGKEAATSIPTAFNELLRTQVPAVSESISPVFASPQAINRYMSTTSQCFVSIVPEFGVALQNICGKYANANDRGLRRALLQIYNKSGHRDILQGAVFADGMKDLLPIARPSFSLLGESTQQEFYKALDENSIVDGLIPRFTVIEYKGKRPRSNRNIISYPSPSLVSRFAEAAAYAKQREMLNEVVNIPFANEDAENFSIAYEDECDDLINDSQDQITKNLYNRAHVQLLKLSALLAVGVNYFNPQITIEDLRWAHTLITHSIDCVEARFQSGNVGESNLQLEQQHLMERCIKGYINKPWTPQFEKSYLVNRQQKEEWGIIHFQYLNANLRTRPAFKNSSNMKQAFDSTLQLLIASDKLYEITPVHQNVKYRGTRTGQMYGIRGDAFR